MMQTALIANAHDDLVTDAAYDMYGLTLATCGLDQRIRIWSSDEATGSWSLEDEWKAHDAAITKLTWAHAIYGTILASASFDRTVKIWEQVPVERTEGLGAASASASGSGGVGYGNATTRWVERTTLFDARGSVRAVEFAPHHFGLKLAAISSDNCLRIYECFEQPSCTVWQTAEEFDVLSLPCLSSYSSAVQGQKRSQTATFNAGTPTPSQSIAGGAVDSASVAGLLQAAQQQSAVQAGVGRPGTGAREADGGWCLSWCKEKYWGEIIAVGAGVGGVVKIIQFSPHRRPQTLLTLEPPPPPPPPPVSSSQGGSSRPGTGSLRGSVPYAVAAASGIGIGTSSTSASFAPYGGPSTAIGVPSAAGGTSGIAAETQRYAVTSVAWAPSCGRSYHLIATGSRDGHVRIWRVRPPAPSALSASAFPSSINVSNGMGLGMGTEGAGGDGEDGEEMAWSATLVADFDDHKSAVGSVQWNVTGTVLSSAGNDGRVRLWKRTVGGVWRPAGQISVEQEEERAENRDVDMDGTQSGAD